MPTYAVSSETLTGIADAIRSKTGSDEQMPIAAFAAAIESISGGGGVTPSKTIIDQAGATSTYTVYWHVSNAMDDDWTILFALNKDFAIDTNNCVLGMLIGKNQLMTVVRYRDGAFNAAAYGSNTSGVINPGSHIDIYKLL